MLLMSPRECDPHCPDLAPQRADRSSRRPLGAQQSFYLLPTLNVIIFFTINGYLLGREYFEFMALSRLAPAAVRKMRKEHRLRVLFAGFAIVLFAMVPLLNLLLPLYGVSLV